MCICETVEPTFWKEKEMATDLDNRFGPYRKPTDTTIPKYKAIQEKTLELAKLIDDTCPDSREKSVALTDLQSAKMWANAAVAIHS